jgi:hypothetical protein
MAEKDKSAEQQLSDAMWTWVGRLVMAAALVGAGFFGGYYQYGDAVELRQGNKELQDQIVDLKNQRETLSTQIARFRRDLEVCRKDLKACRSAAPAAAGE